MITSASDILAHLELPTIIPVSLGTESQLGTEGEFESRVVDLLQRKPLTSTQLATQLEVPIQEILANLCILELSNKIVKDADYWHPVLS